MFYIRELAGLVAPYTPGAIRDRRRNVDSVSAVSGVTARSDSPSSTDLHEEMVAQVGGRHSSGASANAFSAYERALHPETPRRRVIYVHEMMSRDLLTIADGAPLKEAFELFSTRHFRHIPVVDASNALVGVLSERDLLRRAAKMTRENVAHSQWENEPVSSVMHYPVLVATADTEMREIARVMFEERIGCMPIIDESQVLVGIVTRSDVLRTLLVHAPLELWR